MNFLGKLIMVLAICLSLYSLSYADTSTPVEPKKASFGCITNDDIKGGGSIVDMIDNCIGDTAVYHASDASIETGLRAEIIKWTSGIAVLLGLCAVFGIVYGSLILTLSTGEDEKINKAKNVIKWSILGILGVMFASTIIVLIVNIFYSL